MGTKSIYKLHNFIPAKNNKNTQSSVSVCWTGNCYLYFLTNLSLVQKRHEIPIIPFIKYMYVSLRFTFLQNSIFMFSSFHVLLCLVLMFGYRVKVHPRILFNYFFCILFRWSGSRMFYCFCLTVFCLIYLFMKTQKGEGIPRKNSLNWCWKWLWYWRKKSNINPMHLYSNSWIHKTSCCYWAWLHFFPFLTLYFLLYSQFLNQQQKKTWLFAREGTLHWTPSKAIKKV